MGVCFDAVSFARSGVRPYQARAGFVRRPSNDSVKGRLSRCTDRLIAENPIRTFSERRETSKARFRFKFRELLRRCNAGCDSKPTLLINWWLRADCRKFFFHESAR